MTKGDVNKNAYLVRMPMHTLDLILNFKFVILCKVHNGHNSMFGKRLDGPFEFFVFPPCDKIMRYKCLQLGLQILYELIRGVFFIDQVQLTEDLTRSGSSLLLCKPSPLYQPPIRAIYFICTERQLVNPALITLTIKTPHVVPFVQLSFCTYNGLPKLRESLVLHA